MATTDYGSCEKQTEETPLQQALEQHKYRIKDLRATIARNQENLRIELARLAAVKKLAKGGK